MKLPKSWTTVTPFSRKLALILFAMLPVVAFWYGMKYQSAIQSPQGAACEYTGR